eukprot:663887-Pyramimonas_sp.AAC.1
MGDRHIPPRESPSWRVGVRGGGCWGDIEESCSGPLAPGELRVIFEYREAGFAGCDFVPPPPSSSSCLLFLR